MSNYCKKCFERQEKIDRLEQDFKREQNRRIELEDYFMKLEQENKELKEEITKFRWDNPYYVLYNNVVGQRDNLERENEELKKKIKSEKYIKENALQEATKYSMKCGEFRQTLEEIREIAQIHQYFNPELLEIKGDIRQMQDLKMTEIFEKCNEVLNDRD